MKKLFSLLLVGLLVVSGGLFLSGCKSKTLKINYIRFDSIYVDLTIGPNYRFYAELDIDNGTKSSQTIYANNFNATIMINDETYNSAIILCDATNGESLGDSIVINKKESIKVFALIETKINMGSNKQRKIVINYQNEQICSFVPIV